MKHCPIASNFFLKKIRWTETLEFVKKKYSIVYSSQNFILSLFGGISFFKYLLIDTKIYSKFILHKSNETK